MTPTAAASVTRPRPWGISPRFVPLLVGLAWAVGPLFPGSVAGQPRLTLETTHRLPHPVAALAISADETLIAAAAPADGETVTVSLLDRPSGAVAGRIAAPVGAQPLVGFSPSQNLLLVAGSRAVQLWETSPQALTAGKPLAEKFLRWQAPLPEGGPATGLGFLAGPARALWRAGGGVFQRELPADSPFSGQPAWTPEEKAAAAGGLVIGGEGPALFGRTQNEILLLGAGGLAPGRRLEGHRFAVLAAVFDAAGALTSMDGEGNVFSWSRDGQPRLLAHLEKTRGTPAELLALHPPSLLMTARQGPKRLALVLNSETGELTPGPVLPFAGALAVSPTGRYLLAAAGRGIRVYGFSQAMPPTRYADQLKAQGAPALARRYAGLVDARGLSAEKLTSLRGAAAREQVLLAAKDFLVSLEAAEREEELEGMTYWANKLLALDPTHPRGLAALARVRDIKDGRLLEQARRAHQEGEYRQVISLLFSRITPESASFADAQQLIQLAERARKVETVLEQAREQMNRGNFPAARTLTMEALRQDPANPAAMLLREEVAERAGGSPLETFLLWVGLALGMGAVGGGLYRFRQALMPVLRRFSLHENDPGWNPRGRRPHRRPASPPQQPPPRRSEALRAAPPRPRPFDPRQRLEVEKLVEQTEELIRLSRQNDHTQQYTSFLMELEAELSAIQRRLADAGTDWAGVQGRLAEMRTQLGRLKFDAPPEPDPLAPGHTFYDVLQLPGDANGAEIKAAYHKLVKEYHPDLHNSSNFGWIKAQAETMSKKISEAYQVLSHPEQRRAYDRRLAGHTKGHK